MQLPKDFVWKLIKEGVANGLPYTLEGIELLEFNTCPNGEDSYGRDIFSIGIIIRALGSFYGSDNTHCNVCNPEYLGERDSNVVKFKTCHKDDIEFFELERFTYTAVSYRRKCARNRM